jgi:hypothetical protein
VEFLKAGAELGDSFGMPGGEIVGLGRIIAELVEGGLGLFLVMTFAGGEHDFPVPGAQGLRLRMHPVPVEEFGAVRGAFLAKQGVPKVHSVDDRFASGS